jgi:hypothetical protein
MQEAACEWDVGALTDDQKAALMDEMLAMREAELRVSDDRCFMIRPDRVRSHGL